MVHVYRAGALYIGYVRRVDRIDDNGNRYEAVEKDVSWQDPSETETEHPNTLDADNPSNEDSEHSILPELEKHLDNKELAQSFCRLFTSSSEQDKAEQTQ